MRRILKGTLAVFGIVAGLALTAVSCSENTAAPKLRAPDPEITVDRKVADLQAATDWMGNFHTGALTYVQAQLAAAKETARTQVERCKVASKAFKDYTKAYRKDGAPLTIPADFDFGLGCDSGTRASVEVPNRGELAPHNDLSAQAVSYLTRIQNAADADVSDDAFISQVYAIEAEAAATLPAAEATAVFGTGAIAVSSSQYWSSNLSGWNEGGLPMAYSVNVQAVDATRKGLTPLAKFILKADIAGAISSFLKDWFTGVASVEKDAIMGAAASLIAGITRLL